jgi:hypothetical protein
MAILNSKFDFHRGYPNGSALAEPFKVKKDAGVPVSLPGGMLVTQELQNGETVMDAATTPDITSADPVQVWLVMEGNDDYSGQFVEGGQACRVGSGLIWSTDQYEAGSYPPGTPVSFNAGKLKVKGATDQLIGYVLYDKTATEGKVYIADAQ